MDYKNKYYWTFRIESSRYYGEMEPDSLSFITEENRKAWQRFVENKIREVMKPETMGTQEFKECLKKAWQEIMVTECHQGYGMLSKELMIDC